MDLFAAPRPDHSPPENLSDADLALAIRTLRRKQHSVRRSLQTARLAGLAMLAVTLAAGFILLWVGPEPFLPRIFGNGAVVTFPELLAWWATVIGAALFAGIVGYRQLAHRMRVVRAWRHKSQELGRRLEHAEEEARRRAAA